MKKFIACRLCANKGISGKSDGFIYNSENRTLTECECHVKYRKKNNLLYRMEKSGLGKDEMILNYNIDKDYVGTKSLSTIANIKKFLAEYKNYNSKYHHLILYIDGPNGTQKSTIGKYIAREIISTPINDDTKDSFNPNHYKATFIVMNDLIKELTKLSNNEEESKSDLMKRIESSHVLIIDESFDKEKVTLYKSGYQIPYLDSFLRKHMIDSEKSIIFISNVGPSKIEENGYSHSIQDFVERQVKMFNSEFKLEDNYLNNIDTFTTSLFD